LALKAFKRIDERYLEHFKPRVSGADPLLSVVHAALQGPPRAAGCQTTSELCGIDPGRKP